MKKKLKDVVCIGAIALVGLFVAVVQSVFAVFLFVISLYLACLAFQRDTQPWFSSLFIIAAVALFFIGDWFHNYYLPMPAWWRQFVESHRR